MEAELFTNRRTGALVAIPEGGFAFVPRLLPVGHDVLTPELVLALEEATTELGRLDGLGSTLPDANLLIGPFLRKEAELSSRIEGTQTTFSELVMFEAADRQHGSGDVREVSNYVVALKYALSRAQDVGIGRTLVNEMQRLLLAGSGEEHRSGRFRDAQVFIGARGLSIGEARYVPPPAHRLDELFDNLERYIADGEQLPFLVRLAVVHYQFEAIHPFFDGNGRIGRLLMPLLLVHSGVLRAPMLYLSAYFERRRAAYNDAMFAVSADGRWSDWITFVLRGIALQARDALTRVNQLNRLRAKYWNEVKNARNAGALQRLIDVLFGSPVMSAPIARRVLGQSSQTSGDVVRRLVAAQILRPGSVVGRTQFYLAHEIISIVDSVGQSPLPAPSPSVTQTVR